MELISNGMGKGKKNHSRGKNLDMANTWQIEYPLN